MPYFSSGDELVSKTLGSSYKVVKEVYKNLDMLNVLADDETIKTLLDNFEELKGVLDVSDDLLKISENMDAITAAENNATKAETAAASAQTAAEKAASVKQQAQELADLAQQTKEDINTISETVEQVAASLDEIHTVDSNLSAIKQLAGIFSDNITVENIDELITNLTSVKAVAERMNTVEYLADNLLNQGMLDKINNTLTNINELNDVCLKNLQAMKDEVTNMSQEKDEFSFLVQESETSFNALSEEAEKRVKDIVEECEDLYSQMQEFISDIENTRDECNRILLKVRDLYHQFEETLGQALKRASLDLLHTADKQAKRIKNLGDVMAERLDTISDEIIEQSSQEMQENADKIKDDTLEELEEAAQDKVDEIHQIIVESQYGDLRWGYVDYSLAENQEDMEVGITYINAWDDEGYIQINKDTNAFERDPVYIRFYMKSSTGNVSYIWRQIKFNLDEVLAASTTAKGIIEIATTDEVREGTSKELAVTPGTLFEALPDLLDKTLPRATTDTEGILETATSSEVTEGTSTNTAVTPSSLKEALPGILINLLDPEAEDKVNPIVQAIVETITSDEHFMEEFFDSLEESISDLVETSIPDITDATTEQKGIVELADTSETKLGTDGTRAVTPLSLAEALPELLQKYLSKTDDGTTNTIVQAIIKTIQSDVHLQEDLYEALESFVIDSITDTIKQATTEEQGIVELATDEEVKAGTDTERVITPSSLTAALPSLVQNIFTFEDGDDISKAIAEAVTEAIINVIANSEDLQNELADAIEDKLNLDDYAKLAGADFTGSVTVPNQEEEDIFSWGENVVLNKSDILSLINTKKSTYVEILEDAPSIEDDVPTEDVFYAYPANGENNSLILFGEFNNFNLVEDENVTDTTAELLTNGSFNIYNTGNLL